jgi:hypothetical protein
MTRVIIHVCHLQTLFPIKHYISEQFVINDVSVQQNCCQIEMIFFLTNWNDLKRVVPEWLRGLLITKGYLIQLTSVMRLKNTALFLCTQYTLVLIHHVLKKLKCSLFHMYLQNFPQCESSPIGHATATILPWL